jgi:mRNA interferase MazF
MMMLNCNEVLENMENEKQDRKIRRGDIYVADLDPVIGSEQGGERPVLIVQNDVGNKHSPTVIVLAMTSNTQKKREQPTHVVVECASLPRATIALAEQIRTVDKIRLIRYVGRTTAATMRTIDQALKISVGVDK